MTQIASEKQNIKKNKGTRPIVFLVVCSISFMVLVSIGSFIFFRIQVGNASAALNRQSSEIYDKYYVLICEDSAYWRHVHEAAKESAKDKNILVDMISQRLEGEYTRGDLMKIAIESNVNGILLEGEDTDEMRSLIAEADSRGICVVTLGTDCTDSKRKSFVQVGSYNLGKIYGEQVLKNLKNTTKNILVVMDGSNKDSSQNIVFYGIQDTVNIHTTKSISITAMAVDSNDSFATEEDIRKLFMEADVLPDIIICLDEQSTASVYQALVDYNQVGNIRLIGNYNSETILNGIQQGVIEATMSIDTKELGEYAVEAAIEYSETGYVSEYYSVDTELIDSENVDEYLSAKKDGE